jgi:protein involved in polysaccharide export with SLBB domain
MPILRALAVLVLAVCGPGAPHAQAQNRPLVAGDRVLVKLWMDSVFADTARVSGTGSVILPRLGEVSLAGVPANAIGDSIRRAYSRIFSPAAVEVTPLQKVTVVGDVRQSAVFYLEPGATLRDAIAMSGGILEIGRTGRLILLRDSVRTRVSQWQTRHDDLSILRSGDVVVVERESWAKRNAFTIVSGVSVLLSIVLTLAN